MSATTATPYFYQTVSQLTSSIQHELHGAPEEALNHTEMVTARFLCRQRRAWLCGREEPAPAAAATGLPRHRSVTHVLLLGRLPAATRRSLVALLEGVPRPDGAVCYDLRPETALPPTEDGGALQVLVPSAAATPEAHLLRQELLQWCDVVLLCYDMAEREALAELQQRWAAELDEGRARFRQEQQEGDRAAGGAASSRWPAEVPLVLVATGAENRLPGEATTQQQAGLVSSAQLLELASDLGASKAVELCATSAHQVHILARHCQALREEAVAELTADKQEAVQRVKRAFLPRLLRLPPPLVEYDDSTRTTLFVRVPLLSSRCQYYYTVDGSDPTCESNRGAAVVPADGVVPLPPAHGAHLRCAIGGRADGYYASEVVQLALPSRAQPPIGYFHPLRRQLCLTQVPAGSRVRVSRDDGPPEEVEAPGGEVALNVLAGLAAPANATWAAPWPAHRAPPQRLTVTVEGPEEGRLPSAPAVFAVPPVLPAPEVVVDAAAQCVRLQLPDGPARRLADIYYTLDGSTPTYQAKCYTTPLRLTAAAQLRAVALPRLAFASCETIVDLPGMAAVEGAVGAGEEPEIRVAPVPTPRPAGRSRSSSVLSVTTGTTRTAEMRKAFHRGRYVPPVEPFSPGMGTPRLRASSADAGLRDDSSNSGYARRTAAASAVVRAGSARSPRGPGTTEGSRAAARPDGPHYTAATESSAVKVREAVLSSSTVDTPLVTPVRRPQQLYHDAATPTQPHQHFLPMHSDEKGLRRPAAAPAPTPTPTPAPAPAASPPAAAAPSSGPTERSVLFHFDERPILLSNLSVRFAPAADARPSRCRYELWGLPAGAATEEGEAAAGADGLSQDRVYLAGGEVWATAEVQTLPAGPAGRRVPLQALQCVFKGEEGVQVVDVKVHGKYTGSTDGV